jgi:hypothetical protein
MSDQIKVSLKESRSSDREHGAPSDATLQNRAGETALGGMSTCQNYCDPSSTPFMGNGPMD